MSINLKQSSIVIRDLRHVSAQAVFLNDRLTELEASTRTLIAENEYLRGDRAAVVAWLRSDAFIQYWQQALGRLMSDVAADGIERGEHRREEKT